MAYTITRPDGIIRTGTIQPANYDPTADIQAIAHEFANQRMASAQLNGNGLSLGQRVKFWVEGVKSRIAARKMMRASGAVGGLRGFRGALNPSYINAPQGPIGAEGWGPDSAMATIAARVSGGRTMTPGVTRTMEEQAQRVFPGGGIARRLSNESVKNIPQAGPSAVRFRAQQYGMRPFEAFFRGKIGG